MSTVSILFLLLIVIDLCNQPQIFFTALIQYICMTILHVNNHIFISTIYICSILSIRKMIIIICFFCYYDLDIYSLLALYYNIMIYTIKFSIPAFFSYIFYYKTLSFESNIKYLEKLFKVLLKSLIIFLFFFEFDKYKITIISIWLIWPTVRKYWNPFLIVETVPEPRVKVQSITDHELEKLHEFYANTDRKSSIFGIKTEKR